MSPAAAGRPGYYLSRDPRHTVVGALRGVFRIVWFVTMFIFVTALSLVSTVEPGRRHARTTGPARRRFLGRCLARAAGARIRRIGPAPGKIVLFVSNHLSWLDSFVLAGELGGRFVANHVWGTIPVVGTVLRRNGVIFIRRESLRDTAAVSRTLVDIMRPGDPVIVYPEARTTRGAEVVPFRAALLEGAARRGTPVHWGSIRYSTPPGWPPAGVVVSWEDWTPLLLHMYRAFHPPYIEVTIHYGDHPLRGSNRKELARDLHDAVESVFTPQVQMSPEDLERVWVPPPRPVEGY